MNSDNSTLFAKKSLSQNFLINQQIIDKIARKMEVFVQKSVVKNVVEIGPGEGSLTEKFLQWDKKIVALEIDQRAVELLQNRFIGNNNLELLNFDASDYFNVENLSELNQLKPFVLLSNLPFNIGSRLMVDFAITCSDTNFSVILQAEVADKLIENPKHLTFFGCWIKSFWQINKVMSIAPCHFRPAPKVYATLIEANSKKDTNSWLFKLDSVELVRAREVLKSIFSQPRKSLSSHLRLLGLNSEKSNLFYANSGFSPNTRLTWENYERLWGEVYHYLQKL